MKQDSIYIRPILLLRSHELIANIKFPSKLIRIAMVSKFMLAVVNNNRSEQCLFKEKIGRIRAT